MALSAQVGSDPLDHNEDALIHDHDPHEIDKNFLYGKFQTVEDYNLHRMRERDKLTMKAAYKSLDIPQIDSEEMQVASNNTTNNYYGIPNGQTQNTAQAETKVETQAAVPNGSGTAAEPKANSTLGRTLVSAALLAGAAGLGAGTMAIVNREPANATVNIEQQEQTPSTDTDTDKAEGLKLGKD